MNVFLKNLNGEGDCILFISDEWMCRIGLTTIMKAFLSCGKRFDGIYELTDDEVKTHSGCTKVFTDGVFVAEMKELAKGCDKKLLAETKKRIGFVQRKKRWADCTTR